QDHEERAGANDQRSDARRNELLRPRHAAIATEQEQRADHQAVAPFVQRGSRCAAQPDDRVQDDACEKEAAGRHRKWRHGLDRYSNAEIGAAPDHVDRGECGNHREPRRSLGWACVHAASPSIVWRGYSICRAVARARSSPSNVPTTWSEASMPALTPAAVTIRPRAA